MSDTYVAEKWETVRRKCLYEVQAEDYREAFDKLVNGEGHMYAYLVEDVIDSTTFFNLHVDMNEGHGR
jgi:hypothetical protein